MERINQYAYYELGRAISRVTEFSGPDVHPSSIFMALWDAKGRIEELLKDEKVPLGVCRKTAEQVQETLEMIDNEYFYEQEADGKRSFRMPTKDSPNVSSWIWGSLRTSVEAFQTVFSAEMAEATTYFVPRHGIFSTPALIDRADDSFPVGIRGAVPDKARDNWRSAGRCLAFNLFSASGFHVARAVEATMEVYHQLYSGKAGELPSWHEYLKALDAIAAGTTTPKPDAKTLAELRQMKDDYRNPVMHPRISLEENDARMLFNNGESVIIAMTQEIKAIREAGGTQAGLALVGGVQPKP